MKKRSVLIVGGADSVGARLASALSNHADFHPILIDLISSRFDSGFDYIQCNIGNAKILESILGKEINVVVNCVAGSANAMLGCAEALYEAVVRSGARPIVQLSTYAAYGSSMGAIDEMSPLLGDVDAYAAARAKIDRLALAHGAISLRPGIVYGPGSKRWSGQIARLLCANRLGDLGVAGDGQCNLLYMDDLIAAIVAVIEQPGRASGAINLCCSERLTWNDYFVQYAKELGCVPVKRITPRRIRIESTLLAPPLKVAALIAGKLRADQRWVPEFIPPSLLRVCAQDIVLKNDKANNLLGVEWTSVERGFKLAANWFHGDYYVK